MNRTWKIIVLMIFGTAIAPALYGANITLTWTAPGDDGFVGTATQYQIRYASTRITEHNWASATPLSNVPAPAPAGTVQSFVVTNIEPGRKMYFALKARDEAGNWSILSNNGVCGRCNCTGIRGNVNNDELDLITISDLAELLNFLYMGQSSVPCPEEANVDGDANGNINVSDVNRLMGYLFRDADLFKPAPCQ